jgi:hypothetical protein
VDCIPKGTNGWSNGSFGFLLCFRAGSLEDEPEYVGDEDGYASYQANMTGDTVSFAFYFEELAACGSAADGDQGKRESDNRKEKEHGESRYFSRGSGG